MLRSNGPEITFRTLISETYILGTPSIRTHQNIVDIEGICWELEGDEVNENLCPVLVFRKAEKDDLMEYLHSEEGIQASFYERLGLCCDIGRAIGTLHGGYIIHGDIKPENVLVFQDKGGVLTGKVIDFGYACLGLADDDTVNVPISVPWNAPETRINSRFKLKDAKKTDIYSFGLVCLYTLFWGQLMKAPGSVDFGLDENQSVKTLRDWKENPSMILSRVEQLLRGMTDLTDDNRVSLLEFFQVTLIEEPGARSSDFGDLVRRLEKIAGVVPNGMPTVTASFTTDIDAMLHADFHLAEVVENLYYFDYGVRVQIRKAIETRASTLQDVVDGCACKSNAAFQLAFCSKLGFGAPKDENQVLSWLKLSKRPANALQKEIELVRNKPQFSYNSESMRRLEKDHHINSVELGLQYLKRKSFHDVTVFCRREISDMETCLGDRHHIVIALKGFFGTTLSNYGEMKKAQELFEELIIVSKEKYGCEDLTTLSITEKLAAGFMNQGMLTEAEELFLSVAETKKRIFGSNHSQTLRVMAGLVSTYMRQGRWKKAEELLVGERNHTVRILGQEHPHTLRAVTDLATLYRNIGNWKEAEVVEVQAVEIKKKVLGQEHPETLSSISNLAATYLRQGRLEKAEELQVETVNASKKIFGEEHPHTLVFMANLATTYGRQGRLRDSEELRVKLLEIRKRLYGIENPATLKIMNTLATTYCHQGRFGVAEELQVQVIEANVRVLGHEHPDTLTNICTLALIYLNQGRIKEAAGLYEEAVKTTQRVLGNEHPDTFQRKNNLATAYSRQGKPKQAIELLFDIIESQKAVLGEEHPITLTAMGNLAGIYIEEKEWEKATELGEKVLKAKNRVLGHGHPETLLSADNLAGVYLSQMRLVEAEELFTKVMEMRKSSKLFGKEHPTTLSSMNNLAIAYKLHNKYDKALELSQEAHDIRLRVLGETHPETINSQNMLEQIKNRVVGVRIFREQ